LPSNSRWIQLLPEQGDSKGGMQFHFGMRIRHNIAGIQESGALYKCWLYSSAE